jgi:hypothetical protein
MISSGTAYAFGVLGVSAVLYLALRMWYGRERWAAGWVAILTFGLLVGILLGAGMVTWLDAGVALTGGLLGRWIFEPPHHGDQHANAPRANPLDPLAAPDSLASHVQADGDPVSAGSLDLVVRQIERRADLALQEAHALDNKAGFVLGAASFLLIGVTGLQGVVASHMMDRDLVHLVQWLAVGAVLIYLCVVSAALLAYVVHESVIEPEPVGFLERHAAAPTARTQAYLAQVLLRSFQANQQIVEKKTQWTRRALRAFLAESAFLGLILVAIALTL